MTYQVLARKWRPREFSSLIGQQAVVTALTNALREGRIAQAYLFSGIRGVGKTTAARLFAKALNCEKGPEVGPCNACATCAEITAGADLDVLEIDAATYSKVEQVRELTESLQYGPARDRYKVVVLDEVHRLSRQAFDALLKIVEEPPPRLVFIFATTEVDAVPATILSRCQEFHFRRVGTAILVPHLAEICSAESITASAKALALIARAGEGSVRDAVALLDQLATFGNGTVDENDASRLVGGLDLALFATLLSAILAGDSPRVAELGREVENEGWDPRQVHAHFLGFCRDALHLSLGGHPATTELPAEEATALALTATTAGYENLLRLLHHLLGSEASVRRSDAPGLALELAWLRAAELPKLRRIDELLAGGSSTDPLPAESALARAPERPQKRAPAERRPRPTGASKEPATPPAAAEPPAEPAPAPMADPEPEGEAPPPVSLPDPGPPSLAPAGDDPISRFRVELSARRPTLAARIETAALEWRDGELTIALSGDDPFAASQLARQSNRELLGNAVAALFGAGARFRIVEREAAPAPVTAEPDGADAERERAEAEKDTGVQAVLDIFGGAVDTVAYVAASEAPEEESG